MLQVYRVSKHVSRVRQRKHKRKPNDTTWDFIKVFRNAHLVHRFLGKLERSTDRTRTYFSIIRSLYIQLLIDFLFLSSTFQFEKCKEEVEPMHAWLQTIRMRLEAEDLTFGLVGFPADSGF